jgi:hypothetical protein
LYFHLIAVQSISGRLRSASDLEDRGIIDRNQRNLLKDIIISDTQDVDLQKALDQYEVSGDTSGLEHLIIDGQLLQRHHSNTFDLLDDLDLDFLNVTGVDDAKQLQAGDGIGELDFNDQALSDHIRDAMNDPGPTAPLATFACHPGAALLSRTNSSKGSNNVSVEEMQRLRADSIQMFSSLAHGTNSTALAQTTYENWVVGSETSPGSGAESNDKGNKASTEKKSRRKSLNALQKEKEAGDRKKDREFKKAQKEQEREIKRKQKEQEKCERDKHEEHLREGRRMMKEEKAKAKLTKEQELEQKRHRRVLEKMERDREKREKIESVQSIIQCRETQRTAIVAPQSSQLALAARQQSATEEMEGVREETPSGLGIPRSASDPNISHRIDQDGLLTVDAPEGWVGAYSPESRRIRINRFLSKRNHRVWTKTVKYDVRKNFADSRLRVKGRFVKKEDEELMRDLMSLT